MLPFLWIGDSYTFSPRFDWRFLYFFSTMPWIQTDALDPNEERATLHPTTFDGRAIHFRLLGPSISLASAIASSCFLVNLKELPVHPASLNTTYTVTRKPSSVRVASGEQTILCSSCFGWASCYADTAMLLPVSRHTTKAPLFMTRPFIHSFNLTITKKNAFSMMADSLFIHPFNPTTISFFLLSLLIFN